MPALLTDCWCDRFAAGGPACTRLATQEDLLCDTCRAGCNVAVAGRHLAVKSFEVQYTPSGQDRCVMFRGEPPCPRFG